MVEARQGAQSTSSHSALLHVEHRLQPAAAQKVANPYTQRMPNCVPAANTAPEIAQASASDPDRLRGKLKSTAARWVVLIKFDVIAPKTAEV